MNKEDAYIRFNDIVVSLLEMRVWFQEKQIHFTLTELRLLLAFLMDPYKTISAEELVQIAGLTGLRSLYGLISRIRVLLGQKYIVTRSTGYSFVNGRRVVQGEQYDRQTNPEER